MGRLRIAVGVAAVLLGMATATAVMLAAIPSHQHRALAAAAPIVRHPENCRPVDQWLLDARRDLERNRPHQALHDVALSRRDCGADAERYRLEALAYDQLGDRFAALAALANSRDGGGASAERPDNELERQLAALQQRLVEETTRAARTRLVGDFPAPASPTPF